MISRPIVTPLLMASAMFAGLLSPTAAAEKPLDFWDEEIRSIATAPAGKHIDHDFTWLRHPAYFYNRPPAEFQLDHTDKKVGDLSLVYLPGKAQATGKPKTSEPIAKVGFLANLWGGKWSLTEGMILKFHLKTSGTNNPAQWQVVLVDAPGKTARATLNGTDTKGEWKELALPLKSFKADDGFEWESVRLIEFEAVFGADSEIRFDGVRFEDKETYLGITDKPVSQRMTETEATREFRVRHAVEGSSGRGQKSIMAFNKMFLNVDLETANQLLVEDLKQSAVEEDYWNLMTTPIYCRFYYFFSNRAGKFPGRMKSEVEKLLLESIWERTAAKNDIAWSKTSTWWMDGSENHDLNGKVCNLISSRIFMNEPDYKDRIYPDYGFGGAYHYGRAGYYGKGIDPATRHGGGRANLKDGKEYKAADHYAAWLPFIKEYFRERAKRGFFLENGAGYAKYTMNFTDLAYQYGGDEELKKIVGDFLTLYWADWAQSEISGVRGGPRTRFKGVGGYCPMTDIVNTYLGGVGSGDIAMYWNLHNDYRLPKVVWQMALDREGMGEFEYRARGIGEEQGVWPRPLGTERTLMCDTDSRILRYCHVTPDYILGTQMDHPGLVQSHLTSTDRWQGMTFAQSPKSVIAVKNGVMRNAQQKSVLITQAARNFTRVSPEWFPVGGGATPVVTVYTGSDWDEKIEKDGWVFFRKSNAYAAVRPILWDEEYETTKPKETKGSQRFFNSFAAEPTVKLSTKSYQWSADNQSIELLDPYSPIIIQAGRKANDGAFEKFIAAILANPISLHKIVTPGSQVLVYQPFGADKEEIVFNAANMEIPTIDGVPIHYSHPKTFNSPYLQSDYKSGIIRLKFGDEELNLDFTENP